MTNPSTSSVPAMQRRLIAGISCQSFQHEGSLPQLRGITT